MNDTDWAYLAGLIDGEGCLDVRSRGTVAIQIRNSSRVMIDWLESHVPVGRVTSKPDYGVCAGGVRSKRPVWDWYVVNDDVSEVARGIMPYLVAKSSELDIIVEALELRREYSWALGRRGRGCRLPGVFCARMAELRGRIQRLRDITPLGNILTDYSDNPAMLPLFDRS